MPGPRVKTRHVKGKQPYDLIQEKQSVSRNSKLRDRHELIWVERYCRNLCCSCVFAVHVDRGMWCSLSLLITEYVMLEREGWRWKICLERNRDEVAIGIVGW